MIIWLPERGEGEGERERGVCECWGSEGDERYIDGEGINQKWGSSDA